MTSLRGGHGQGVEPESLSTGHHQEASLQGKDGAGGKLRTLAGSWRPGWPQLQAVSCRPVMRPLPLSLTAMPAAWPLKMWFRLE